MSGRVGSGAPPRTPGPVRGLSQELGLRRSSPGTTGAMAGVGRKGSARPSYYYRLLGRSRLRRQRSRSRSRTRTAASRGKPPPASASAHGSASSDRASRLRSPVRRHSSRTITFPFLWRLVLFSAPTFAGDRVNSDSLPSTPSSASTPRHPYFLNRWGVLLRLVFRGCRCVCAGSEG